MRVISGTARGTKLNSIDDLSTRPTLDRVKESLFNIIQNRIVDARVLDLFAGSGAIAIECLSRGCEKAVLCDKQNIAIKMVKQNLEKTKFLNRADVYNMDYKKCLDTVKNEKFDLIFIDPPYKMNIAVDAIKRIIELDLLAKDGIIILETDDEKRELEGLEKLQIDVHDVRKYGRVKLVFLHGRG